MNKEPRLRFTDEERSDPALEKPIRKAEKAAARADKAQANIDVYKRQKYDITRHPNFKYTADADKRNTFDIEAFLSARLKLKPDEVCDVYEVDTKGA